MPQRRPQATTLKRAGLSMTCACPRWGILNLIVVEVFEADGLFVVNMLVCLVDSLGVFQQGIEGGVELVQAGVCQSVSGSIWSRMSLARRSSFSLIAGVEAGDIAVQLLLVFVTEIGFDGAPLFQGFGRDVELGAGALQVTVKLVDAIEGLDFGIQGVAFFHGMVPLA